jgi:pimeloyl-ACP methyl ester carboxylesterase
MSTQVTTVRGDTVDHDLRGSGPGLIFIAGAGMWRAIDDVTGPTAELAAAMGIATIEYDRLGRGANRVTGRIDLDRELEAVAALIEAIGGRAVLCGHSSGCSIALAAAVRGLPVAGLALWEAPMDPATTGVQAWVDEVGRRIDAGDLEGAQLHFMKDMPPEFLEGAKTSPAWPAMVEQAGALRPDGESLVWATSAPHAELFGDLAIPVQIMYGEQTFPEMRAAADSLVAAIPGATRREMPGAMHSWEPEPMATELARFTMAAASRTAPTG